jgi:hypothetical protein
MTQIQRKRDDSESIYNDTIDGPASSKLNQVNVHLMGSELVRYILTYERCVAIYFSFISFTSKERLAEKI